MPRYYIKKIVSPTQVELTVSEFVLYKIQISNHFIEDLEILLRLIA